MIIAQDSEVILREFEETDIPKIVLYANNKKVSNNLRDAFPNPYTLDDAKRFFDMISKQNPKTFFAIEYKGNYAGNIGLSVESDVYKKRAEIGYFIGEPLWNRGIATKAITMMTAFGFATLDIVRIHTGVFGYNIASQKVLEKCGFEKEAVFKKAIYKNGALCNEIRYAIIKDEI